jgi:hypothetical protein
VAAKPLDVEAVARAIPSVEDRWCALQFSARMAWTDRQLGVTEKATLVEVAAGLNLAADAVERVLAEMLGRGGRDVPPARLREAVQTMEWEEADYVARGSRSGLRATLPTGEVVIGCVTCAGVEQAVLCESGFAAGFREKNAFVRWSDIESYTRVPVFGAAVRVYLREGESLTLVDLRVRVLASFFDRLFA